MSERYTKIVNFITIETKIHFLRFSLKNQTKDLQTPILLFYSFLTESIDLFFIQIVYYKNLLVRLLLGTIMYKLKQRQQKCHVRVYEDN